MNPQGPLVFTFAETDRGVMREENEDSLLLHDPGDEKSRCEKGILAIVADGVGGEACGKMASSMAVNLMRDQYYASSTGNPLNDLKESIEAANRGILNKALHEPSCNGMATTCTAFLLLGHQGFITHLGDSRAYLYRGGKLLQITNDHTLVNRLVEEGLLTIEAAKTHPQRNIITKSLGSSSTIEPDTYQVSLEDNDIILLCSDGLYGMVSDDDIVSVISSNSLQEAGRFLIELAKKNGGRDNITAILLHLSGNQSSTMNATRPYTFIDENRKGTVFTTVIIVALFFFTILYLCSRYDLLPSAKH